MNDLIIVNLFVRLISENKKMGFLGSLFGKSTKINNNFFGEMLFNENKRNPDKSYFECSRNFRPSAQLIEIGIDGDISGPAQAQIDFFIHIEDNYSEISRSITPLIEDEFRNWQENFKIEDFQKEFRPVYLRIPGCETKPIIWEIAFESDLDRNHQFTLTMNDFEAKTILIDG
jgi:hypothetical protein